MLRFFFRSRALVALIGATLLASASVAAQGVSFSVTYKATEAKPLDGRVLLLISTHDRTEPRFQVSGRLNSAQVFGVDVDAWQPGKPAIVDARTFGFPVRSLASFPAGEYFVQAVFQKYDTFKPAHGHTIKLPMDQGEGRQWNRAPGNLYSKPQKIRIDAAQKRRIEIVLDQAIPPIEPPKDTKYIKHVKIQSQRLTKFWGRPMYLGAHVLLPHGFDEHSEARYPLMVFHGHFPADFDGFRTEPPDPNLKCVPEPRFGLDCYNRTVQQEAYDFYKKWTSPNFPRFLVIEIQHANPFYDDSYAVNSANLGPYGDAIQYELIPHIEKMFRGIGAGWARFTYGGSTGGWEALAVQMFYPDEYNGTFAACPDPIDFRAYTTVDIYKDKNAYYYDNAQFLRMPRPGFRDYLGQLSATVESFNHMELALGANTRSGDQFDIWQAVYSPVGKDGYPAPIWDKLTGEIDHKVAEYWRENYDLRHILQRDWAKLGPKLAGKIHIFCGDMDNYYLNNAVYLTEDFLKTTKNPAYGGEVDYGDRAEHCWNGDHENPNAISRLRYNLMYLPRILKRIEASAPPGADLKSWRY